MRPLCIYHANCQDGFAAAWVVNDYFKGMVDIYPGHYDRLSPIQSALGRDVIMVDFSYKRPEIEALRKAARSVLILDHHKSAQAELETYERCPTYAQGWRAWSAWTHDRPHSVCTVFDMDRSGAGITWDFFYPDKHRPRLIDVIEDRDLWRFKYGDDTRDVSAALFSYPYNLPTWDDLIGGANDTLSRLKNEGVGIRRKHDKDIAELLPQLTRTMAIGGYEVPVANLPYTMASDAAGLLAHGNAFAACYFDAPDGRTFSLRSRAGGIDVSEIAEQYGGGGHAGAAGFRVPRDHELAVS